MPSLNPQNLPPIPVVEVDFQAFRPLDLLLITELEGSIACASFYVSRTLDVGRQA